MPRVLLARDSKLLRNVHEIKYPQKISDPLVIVVLRKSCLFHAKVLLAKLLREKLFYARS